MLEISIYLMNDLQMDINVHIGQINKEGSTYTRSYS